MRPDASAGPSTSPLDAAGVLAMISDRAVAEQVSRLMLNLGRELNDSVKLVQDSCSPEELNAYRSAVGKVMGEVLLAVLNPLYAAHPELKPKELR